MTKYKPDNIKALQVLADRFAVWVINSRVG